MTHPARFAFLLLALVTLLACGKAPIVETPAEEEVDTTVWIDAIGLGIRGQAWKGDELAHPCDRLPARVQPPVTREVMWSLSEDSAGMSIRFITDAPEIKARWTPRKPGFTMDHMADAGISGLDLYVRTEEGWRWCGVGRITRSMPHQRTMISNIPEGEHEYLLFLPLYNGIESLDLGVPEGHTITAAPADTLRPIVFYGTSITQGGCASRAGMAYTTILERRLDRPTINLGFSGNGRMDLFMADLLAEIDAEVYVLDTFPNMSVETIEANFVNFMARLRTLKPDTPILVVENVFPQSAWFIPTQREGIEAEDEAVRQGLEQLAEMGHTGFTLVENGSLIGDDSLGTVDGIHFTDLGFMRMADTLEPIIREAMGE